jgi:hypothetical protein
MATTHIAYYVICQIKNAALGISLEESSDLSPFATGLSLLPPYHPLGAVIH